MKARLGKMLTILKPLVLFMMVVAVMLLPFVQFIYAAAYGFSDSGESGLHTTLAHYSFHLMLVTGPCLYGLALYMLRDLRALLPDKALFAIGGKILLWVLRILFGLACCLLAAYIVVIGVEYSL